MRNILVALIISVVIGGCQTPASVRTLSEEQVRAQIAYAKTLVDYFAVIERFAEAEMQAANRRVDEAAKAIVKRDAKLAAEDIDLDKTGARRKEILEKLGETVNENSSQTEQKKSQIAARVNALKEKHHAILGAYQTIIEAQRRLNDYLQLQKADEVLAAELLGTVKLNAEQISQRTVELNTIFNDISKLVH
jgi:hypothetical protein